MLPIRYWGSHGACSLGPLSILHIWLDLPLGAVQLPCIAVWLLPCMLFGRILKLDHIPPGILWPLPWQLRRIIQLIRHMRWQQYIGSRSALEILSVIALAKRSCRILQCMRQHILALEILSYRLHVCNQSNCVFLFGDILVVGFPFNPHSNFITALAPDESVQLCLVLVIDKFPFYILVNFYLPYIFVGSAGLISYFGRLLLFAAEINMLHIFHFC